MEREPRRDVSGELPRDGLQSRPGGESQSGDCISNLGASTQETTRSGQGDLFPSACEDIAQPTTPVADLSTVILECVRRARDAASPGLQVAVHDEAPAVFVRGDSARLHEVIATLVEQAANALAGRPGCITVSSGRLRLPEGSPPDALMGPRPERVEYAWFEVADDGPGLSHEERAQLFSAEFPSKYPELGRGLAHVHDLIVAHGGSIQVESQLGRGARFHVRWPMAPRSNLSLPPDRTATPVGPHTIVVVDDDDAVRHVTAALLRAHGANCLELTSGAELLAMLQRGETVDAVVLDEMMPHKTGRETLLELRASWPDLPVVMVSGHIDLSELLMLNDAQLDYLAKPFDAEVLYSRLLRLLRLQHRS